MEVQLCEFKSGVGKEWEHGLAWMRSGFDISDVEFIVDKEGKRLSSRDVLDYVLVRGPHCYISTVGRQLR